MIARLLPLIGTGILIAIVALLGMRAAEVSQIKITSPETVHERDVPTSSAPQTRATQRPAVYYAAITERPVFDPSRRPYVPVAVAPEPVPEPVEEAPEPSQPKEVPPPELTLQGIITRDERTAALIGINGEVPSWVTQGDPVADWTLNDIGNDWIEISRDARIIRMDMYK